MKKFLAMFVLLLGVTIVCAQQKNYTVYSLSFYNWKTCSIRKMTPIIREMMSSFLPAHIIGHRINTR